MGQLETIMVCHSLHLTGIMITFQLETVLSPIEQDGGTIGAGVQY